MAIHATHLISDSQSPRIGPNAIIRVAEVLREQAGDASVAHIFRAAGLDSYLSVLPEEMVDEREVSALHQILRGELGITAARAVSWEAGRRTGDYLLAKRIPRGAQLFLRILPPMFASPILLAAIRHNAWTFSGSGLFNARSGNPVQIEIAGCPICRGAAPSCEPLCDYYAATFERLFHVLVTPRAKVTETACQALGATACKFRVAW